jgi:O-antigen/teichoic acid export membrane protein
LELRKHIQPLFVLFANTIAISIYVNLDITMLGWFKGDYEVGVYSVAVKVYSIIKSMLAAIYAVAIPRLAAYIGSKNEDGYRTTNTNLWCYLSIILIPSSVGLICLSSDIMRFMGGADFANHGLVLQILGVALVFAIFGGLVTACLNVTLGREKDNLLATIIAALLNCELNLFMIPMFAQNGAAITTLIAEAFVLIFCTARVPSISTYLDKKEVIKEILHSLIGSIAIVIIASSLKMIIGNYVARIACIIVASVVIYFVVLLFLKDRYTKEIMINIKHRIFK